MRQIFTAMDSSSALTHLDSIVRSTEGPAIEAWPARLDGDTSEDSLTLVNVDSVVVIEPFGVHCCCHRATLWTRVFGIGHW